MSGANGCSKGNYRELEHWSPKSDGSHGSKITRVTEQQVLTQNLNSLNRHFKYYFILFEQFQYAQNAK